MAQGQDLGGVLRPESMVCKTLETHTPQGHTFRKRHALPLSPLILHLNPVREAVQSNYRLCFTDQETEARESVLQALPEQHCLPGSAGEADGREKEGLLHWTGSISHRILETRSFLLFKRDQKSWDLLDGDLS